MEERMMGGHDDGVPPAGQPAVRVFGAIAMLLALAFLALAFVLAPVA
ncbi:MAG: hypothetical protein J2O49_00775 [Sciscionella sp.]|nr:hypothetical protein [Sciscionella sp.]